MRGYLQVYTGDGKGKTTAALGLAVRAVGAGLRVYVAQFVKGMAYSELSALAALGDRLEIHQFGRDCFIEREPAAEDVEAARAGLAEAARVIQGGDYDLVILDEANIATHFGLFSVEELLAALEPRPEGVEIVVTGRRADPQLVARADLVTEMREIKHYYQRGVPARRGIES